MTTDANGNKTSEYRYTPYGGVRVAWGSLPTNRKFTGYAREDAIGGIDFAQARFYDSVIGRFLSADTIVPNSADPQSLNRFSYVLNRPTVMIDPTGHDPWWQPDELQHEAAMLTRHFARQVGAAIQSGTIGPVEGLAQISGQAWMNAHEQFDFFMWIMTVVLVGVDPDTQDLPTWALFGRQTGIYFSGWGLFARATNGGLEQGDWNNLFWDNTADQASHFWFYVALAYYSGNSPDEGQDMALLGNNYQDPVDPVIAFFRGRNPADSTSDNNLGRAGASFGYELRVGWISPRDISHALYVRLRRNP